MSTGESKTCSKCGETKALVEFHSHPGCRLGVRPECKVCNNASINAHRKANIARERQRDRERYANSPERRAAQIQTSRAHYAANRDDAIAYRRQHYEANKETYATYRMKREARARAVEHEHYTRTEIFERDGGKCRLCGLVLVNQPRGFSIDHIVPIALGGPDTPANLQLTCQPCNRRKWMNLEGQIHLPV